VAGELVVLQLMLQSVLLKENEINIKQTRKKY
jgi:hypothetical protein